MRLKVKSLEKIDWKSLEFGEIYMIGYESEADPKFNGVPLYDTFDSFYVRGKKDFTENEIRNDTFYRINFEMIEEGS